MENRQFIQGGIALSEEDITQNRVFFVEDSLNCRYAWDTGVAIGRYLAELKNGKIIAKKFNECNRILVPPRMFCELCFRPTDDWVFVQDTGVVNTFSLCYVNWDASRIAPGETPHLPAVIEIDGTTKMIGIMHKLGEVNPSEIKVGMKVKAVWKPAEERTGAITDIKYFKPY
jgi:uncharacterized OB-fold protein